MEVERHGGIKRRKSRFDIKIRKKIQKKKARKKDEEKALSLRRIHGTFKKALSQKSANGLCGLKVLLWRHDQKQKYLHALAKKPQKGFIPFVAVRRILIKKSYGERQ